MSVGPLVQGPITLSKDTQSVGPLVQGPITLSKDAQTLRSECSKKKYLLRYHIIVYSCNIKHWSGGRDFWRLGGTRSRRAFPASVYWGNAVVPSSEGLEFAFLFVRTEIYNPSIVITYHKMNCSPLDEICPSKGWHRSKDNIVKRFFDGNIAALDGSLFVELR